MAPRLRFHLAPHEVYTVEFMGWKVLKNGLLLAHAERVSFEALVTVDKNLEHQQNIAASTLGFVVLGSNLWPRIAPQLHSIVLALDACTPGSIQRLEL